MDERRSTEEFVARQLDLSADNGLVYAEYRRLAADQAALRRLARWWPAGWNRRRCSMRWSRKCVAVCPRRPPDCGATSQATKSRSGRDRPSCSAAGEVARGNSNPDRRQHPRGDGATHRPARADGQLREGRRVGRCTACGTWAYALRWACRSSSMVACGAWRPWVRLTRAHAGRHRGPHQRLRRTDRCRRGGRTPRRAETANAR